MKINKWFLAGLFTLLFTVASVFFGSRSDIFSEEIKIVSDMFFMISFVVVLLLFKNLSALKGKLKLFSGITLFLYILLLLMGQTMEVLQDLLDLSVDLKQQTAMATQYLKVISLVFLAGFMLFSSFVKRLSLKIYSTIFLFALILLIFLEIANTYILYLLGIGYELLGLEFELTILRDVYGVLFLLNNMFLGIIFIRHGTRLPAKRKVKKK